MVQKKGLGRGLNSLISTEKDNENTVFEIDINKIEPNKNQPRKRFDKEALEELAESIKEVGLIQPITVKKTGDYYEIIAGERRWRASRLAKLKTVPVIIKSSDELKSLEIALIENIQRENLNPVEEAMTYKRFSEEFSLTQEQIAKKVGKNRATVSNVMRILNLDDRVLDLMSEGRISLGHGKALLSLENTDMQFELAETVIEEELSVRQTEEAVKQILNPKVTKVNNKKTNPYFVNLSKELNSILGTKVNIKNKDNNKGKIEIEYYNQDDLDRIICILKKNI